MGWNYSAMADVFTLWPSLFCLSLFRSLLIFQPVHFLILHQFDLHCHFFKFKNSTAGHWLMECTDMITND